MKFELLTGEVCLSDLLMHKAYSVPTLLRVVFIKATSCSQYVVPPKGLRRFYYFWLLPQNLLGGSVRYMPCGSAPLSAKVTSFIRCVMGCYVSWSVAYVIMRTCCWFFFLTLGWVPLGWFVRPCNGVQWSKNTWKRYFKGLDDAILVPDSSAALLHHDPSDLGSLIVIRIISKEHLWLRIRRFLSLNSLHL